MGRKKGGKGSTTVNESNVREEDVQRVEVSEAVVTLGVSHAALPVEDLIGSSGVVQPTIVPLPTDSGAVDLDTSDATVVVYQIPYNAVPLTFSFEMDNKYTISISTKACKADDIIPTDNQELLLQFALIFQHIINLHDGEHQINYKDRTISFASDYSDISDCTQWFEVFSQPGDKITTRETYAWILSVQDLLTEIIRTAFYSIIINNTVDNSLYGGFDADLHESYTGQCHDVGITADDITAITMHFLLDNRYEVSVEAEALVGKQITSDNKKLLLQIACIVQTVIDKARQNHKDHSIKVDDEIVAFAVNYADQSDYKSWVEACKKPDDLDDPDGWIISVQDLFLSLGRKAIPNIEEQSTNETVLVGEFKVAIVEHYSVELV